MFDQILNEHQTDIQDLFTNQFGLSNDHQQQVSSVFNNVLSDFLHQKISGGSDLNHLTDLFNKNTSNTGNALFPIIGGLIAKELQSKTSLSPQQITNLSSGGLDQFLSVLQQGKLGNINAGNIGNLVQQFSGQGGIGNIGDMIKKFL